MLLLSSVAAQKPVPAAHSPENSPQPSPETTSVPEPGILVVVGGGILALALVKRKRR